MSTKKEKRKKKKEKKRKKEKKKEKIAYFGLQKKKGGEKYIVANIMFKFALDSSNVLGSDYAATKVAGHELKGI